MGYSKLTYEEYVCSPDVYGTDIPQWAAEIAERGCVGVSAIDFYDDIFGEDLEEERLPEDYVTGEYAGIAIERVKRLDANGQAVVNERGREVYNGRRVTITKGNQELYDLIEQSDNFCILAPISYAGRMRTNKNARFMYAFCIEVDDINPHGGLSELFYSWERDLQPVPKPTYIVCSGNGLHLYYVFERPIPLWRNIFESFTEAKKYLTPRLWTRYITTSYQQIQYGSVNQPFRCVGTRTKSGGYTLAFEVGGKVTIEYLNKFLPADKQLDCVYKSYCSLEEAKKRYPSWYKRRIEKGQPRGHWKRYEPIYHNWKEKILNGAIVGKRYNCLENLCSLAVQCNIAPEQVEKDCREVAEYFERLTIEESNHFTEYDIICALRTYHTATDQAYRRKIEFISRKTGIPLEPNPRNGRSQMEHLRAEYLINSKGRPEINPCRKNRELSLAHMRENGEILGRPKGSDKRGVVQKWRSRHPDGTKAQCIKDTKLSKPTVYKWWDVK